MRYIWFCIGIILLILITTYYHLRFFSVISGSMIPSIPVGALIIVKPQKNYQIGSVITFYSSKNKFQTTTHRIVSIENDNFMTKGDANSVSDLILIPKNQIIGQVIFHIPFIGNFFTFVKTKIGSVFLIVLPCLVIIYSQIKSFTKLN